ncbi:hypothetical protein ACL9RI_21655 [Janthinobacterium sp. Mn2066]|uniref:hypothetical protein n=1 Tax=Janthinobacterium sp. Mn2066 TaxID=3395264 RepID=UPI003BBF230B
MTHLGKALILVIWFAVVAALAGLLHAAPWTGASLQRLALWAVSCGCVGLLLGGIYAFDAESELKIKSSAVGRTAIGIAASLLLAVVWRWPLEGMVLAGSIGAALGYLGMLWAKYAYF